MTDQTSADQAAAKAFAEQLQNYSADQMLGVPFGAYRELARAYLALQQENADWQKRVGALCDANSNLVRGHEAQQQELAELRRALAKYGRHHITCDYQQGLKCNCGFTALARKETP